MIKQCVVQGSLPKKPYNPIIGETFHCSWDVSDREGSETSHKLVYTAEQVSHHPPGNTHLIHFLCFLTCVCYAIAYTACPALLTRLHEELLFSAIVERPHGLYRELRCLLSKISNWSQWSWMRILSPP